MTDVEATDFQSVIQQTVSQRNAWMGLKEVTKSVAQGKSACVFLANDVGEAQYKALVEAICRENKTALINVDSKEILGQWCGLAKLDEEGEVVKARSCGCVSIKQLPNSPAGEKLKEFIKTASA
jgi:small subunit ribosomal protein S12e